MTWEYLRPADVFEAVALLKRPSPRAVVLGGGCWLNEARPADVQAVVDVSGLGLNKALVEGRLLRLGAAMTHQQLAEHDLTAPDSSSALRLIGQCALYTPQALRSRATLAGAIVTASLDAPLIAALLAFNAEVVVAGARDLSKEIQSPSDFWKVIPLGGFLSYGDRVLREGTLITEIRLAIPSPDTRSAYVVSPHAPELATALSFALKDGIAGNVRIVLSGLMPKPIRLSRLEFGLEKKRVVDWLDSELEAQLELLQLEAHLEARVRGLVHRAVHSLL